MEKKTKKRIKQLIRARNTVLKMSKAKNNPYPSKYINSLTSYIMDEARKIHPLLPYYFSIKAI